MNTRLKIFLIILNGVMLLLGIIWYNENQETEPLIVCTGQVVALVSLLFERKITEVITERISSNSKVDIQAQSGDKITTKDINESEVKVKIDR